jgi:integrase
VRVHTISTQLDAIIALALHLGLRRSEIFRLSVNDLHYENAYVVVRDQYRRASRRAIDESGTLRRPQLAQVPGLRSVPITTDPG